MIHRLLFRVITHSTEDPDRVAAALDEMVPENSIVQLERVDGHHRNVMHVLTATVDGKHDATQALAGVLGRLGRDDLERIKEELPRRVDEECAFHLRLDKQQAYGGKVVLANNEDCIFLRARVECYPARHDTAVEVVGVLIDGL